MNPKLEDRLIFWLFLAPVLFAFFMVIVIPFFMGAYYSFTDWSASARTGAGLQAETRHAGDLLELVFKVQHQLQHALTQVGG